jgi:anti-anti-sigma regulatory factor
MSIVVKKRGKSRTLILQGTIDINSASELKAALAEAIRLAREVRVSLGEVTALDLTAVQLLWSAAQLARRSGVSFDATSNLPDQLLQGLQQDGLGIYLPRCIADMSIAGAHDGD